MRAWFSTRLERLRNSMWWRDASERAIWQAAQGAGAALAVAVSFDTVPWQLLISYALGGALASLLASVISIPDPNTRSAWRTVVFRLLRTAAAALAALLVARFSIDGQVDFFAIDWSEALKLIGFTVLIAFVKNTLQFSQPERAPPVR
jgi:hypothetical protein